MLVLSRKIGEVITVGTSVKITVLSFDRGIVRLGIDAPKSVPVHRKEVYDKIIEMNQQASKTGLDSLKKAIDKSGVKFTELDRDINLPQGIKFSARSRQKIKEQV